MNIETVRIGNFDVSVVTSDDVLIRTPDDALDLIANAPTENLLLFLHNFEADFFDLSTRKLGEALLKFTNYRTRLAVIGDFDQFPSTNLKAFIYESNRHGEHIFVPTMADVAAIWER